MNPKRLVENQAMNNLKFDQITQHPFAKATPHDRAVSMANLTRGPWVHIDIGQHPRERLGA